MFRRHASGSRWWDDHMREILHGASTAFVLKGLGALLTLGVYVLLGRLLGPAESGLYFLALTLLTVAAILGRIGLDNTVLRFVAASAATEDWEAVQGVRRKASIVAILASSVATVALAVAAPWLSVTVFAKPELAPMLRWMALAIVPTALLTLQAQALQGLRRIAAASLVGNVGVPLFLLGGSALLAPRWGALGATVAYVLAAFLTMLLGIWRWRRSTPHLRTVSGRFDISTLLESSVPLFWVSCFQQIITWAPTVILGVTASSSDVGIFGAANRAAQLTSFVLLAVNSISAPKFAALHRTGDLATLGRVARRSAKLMAVLASPILIVFVVFPTRVMTMFGPEFAAGAHVLTILAVGQFVNVVTGSVGWLLIMCGYERLMRDNIAVCALLGLVLSLVLIPAFGVVGAAIASATTLALQMIIATIMVWQKLGVLTISFGRGDDSAWV
jgi:O-antigen/teichoic acid export membrane protein